MGLKVHFRIEFPEDFPEDPILWEASKIGDEELLFESLPLAVDWIDSLRSSWRRRGTRKGWRWRPTKKDFNNVVAICREDVAGGREIRILEEYYDIMG